MKSEELRDEAISTVSFDYSYCKDKLGKMTREEYSEALSKGVKMNRPMIVVEDREKGAIFAHMCSQNVKSTSPVTENHYKSGYVNYKNSIMTNEDNNRDTMYTINNYTNNHNAHDLHE